MKLKLIACLALAFAFHTGAECQIFNSKLTRRHKKMITENTGSLKTDSRAAPVEIIVSVQPPSSPSPRVAKTFLDLAPEVQKELIKRLERLESNGDGLMNQLKKNFSNKASGDEGMEIVDMTEQRRQIVLGVYNNSQHPGDRIYRISSNIKTTSQEVYFTSCDAVITKYETLEISKQTQTSNLGFELGGNAGSTVVTSNGGSNTDISGGETTSGTEDDKSSTSKKNTSSTTGVTNNSRQSTTGLGATGKFNASKSRTEEGRLRQRYVALSGNIMNKGVKLYTESVSGIDLTGNIIAEVSFRFTNTGSDFIFTFDKLLQAAGTPETPANIIAKPKFVVYPLLTGDVVLDNISTSAVVRTVLGKERTIMEGDDKVAMLDYNSIAPSEPNPVLVRAAEVIPKKWVIKTPGGAGQRLRISTVAGGPSASTVLNFESIHQANALLEWLRSQPAGLIGAAGAALPIQGGKYILQVQGGISLAAFLANCNPVYELNLIIGFFPLSVYAITP